MQGNIFHREISADLPGKKGKEERESGKEKKANLKGKRWNIENGRRKGMEMSRGLLCVGVCLSIFA